VAAYEVIRQTGTGVSGDFAASNKGDIFHTVIGQTKQAFLANARWMMNRTTLATTRKIKDGDGTYLWEKSFQANQPFVLLGYPVTLAEDMPAIGSNSLSIGFGDFRRAYKVVDRMGISVLVDPYTSTTGFVKYKTRKRVGGAVVNFEAVQLIKFG
jgi:HK97 family phage major capsid protein